MNYTYFLAANTASGFYSIYNSFPPGKNDFLHIIKGGPGSGKSGFMRKIGRAAEECGLSVHYILCSGDPGSLDGLYIPELRQAWVDGTNPHSREPELYGVNSDYVNLGSFFDGRLSSSEKDYVNLYTKAYKEKYKLAYSLLSSVRSLRQCRQEADFKLINSAFINYIEKIFEFYPKVLEFEHKSSYRFLSSIGCMGDYRLYSEFYKLCNSIYVIQNSPVSEHLLLEQLKLMPELSDDTVILCPSSLDPRQLTALIFPERGLAFTDSSWKFKKSIALDLEKILPVDTAGVSLYEEAILSGPAEEIMSLAYKNLSEAKEFHDKLEQQYHSHIDFSALNSFTDSKITELFH